MFTQKSGFHFAHPINKQKPTLRKIGVNICYGLAVLQTNRMWAQRQSSSEHDTPPTCTGGHALACPPLLSAWDTDVRIEGGWQMKLLGG
jgi:hypothetical protein